MESAVSNPSKEMIPLKLTILVIRWFARITSIFSLSLLALFLMGGERFNPAARELVGLALFPFGVGLGLIIAWWKEGVGAAISLLSLLGFYTIFGWFMGSNVKGPWFVIFASPAFLFLIAWFLSRTRSSEVTVPS